MNILIDLYARTWIEGEWEGDERNSAVVEEVAPGKFQISLDQYYSKDGVFAMTITQPLERAIRTFIAALAADTEEEIS